MRKRRWVATLGLAAALSVGVAGQAAASHVHVRVLGNGQCVVMAENGGEKWVSLPDAVLSSNPNVVPGNYAEDRLHPLHVLVHIAGAGNGEVYVYGSAGDLESCAGYVNG